MNEGQEYGGFPTYQWYTIHSIALIVISCSLYGSTSIIIHTIKINRKTPLFLIHKFPMYVSITDVLFGLFHGLDHLVSISTNYVSQGNFCVFLGFGTVYAMMLPSFWTASCGCYIFALLGHNRQLYFGTGDWGLHVINWGIPLIIQYIALSQGEFGPEAMWCGMPNKLWEYNSLPIIVGVILNTLLYSMTIFLIHQKIQLRGDKGTPHVSAIPSVNYFSLSELPGETPAVVEQPPIIKEPRPTINKQRENSLLDKIVHFNSKSIPEAPKMQSLDDKLKKTARLLPIFVLIFVIQWTPYVVYAVLLERDIVYFELNVIVVLIANSGGIWNALAYQKLLERKN